MTTSVAIAFHPDFCKHLTGSIHPESPQRCLQIIQALRNNGLLKSSSLLIPQMASPDQLLLCHSENYIHIVSYDVSKANLAGAFHGEFTLSTGDVQICPLSFDVALLAVGAAFASIDAVLTNQFDYAFACIRPPGHHANNNVGMGFCIFNNAALAARYAQNKYGLKRVAIIDWDVHHGNGTQDIFYNDPSVFYFSTHQQGIFPHTGYREERGCDNNILNCPILGGTGSRIEVLHAFNNELYAVMNLFKPELIIISAGFDAHIEDPLGQMDLTTQDFATLTSIVKDIAKKHPPCHVISVLEGGYHLDALSASVCAHVQALMND